MSQYHGLVKVTSSDTKVGRLPPMVTLYKIVYRTFKERKANERKEIGVCARRHRHSRTLVENDWDKCERFVQKLQARIVKAQGKAEITR